jgi:putative transcriptional regulator
MSALSGKMVLLRVAILAGLLLAMGAAAGPQAPPGSLKGSFLVAAPSLADPNFARTVVYMIDHGPEGAFGVVVNRRLGQGPLGKLMAGFGLPAEGVEGEIALYAGGPVQEDLGFMLHSPDYRDQTTREVSPTVSLSTNVAVLDSIARDRKPARYLFAFGYAGWGPGQLEQELARKDWLIAAGDSAIIFDAASDADKWARARKAAGITL